MANDVKVLIGRFNPFHLGHAHVLSKALQTSRLVIVLVGSSFQARTLKNPFTFAERKAMIQDWFEHLKPGARLIIKPLIDHPYNDVKWAESVQNLVTETVAQDAVQHDTLHTSISLTGSHRDASTWYLSSFPQWRAELVPEFNRPPDLIVSATSVREILFGSPNWSVTDRTKLCSKVPASTADYLLKFRETAECALLQKEHAFISAYRAAWSSAPYAPTFVTTDAVVVQSGHVLVIERGAFPGKGLWALPGGFLNQNERLADGCVRELIEETGIKVPEALLRAAIKTAPKEIFDKPDRSQRGRTITTAFLIRLDDTKPLPKVKGQNAPLHETGGLEVLETAKAFWLPISSALKQSERWFEDHHALLSWGVSQLHSQ